MSAQYHDTKCLICKTTIHAPVENFVCSTCHNDDYSTVADFIVKQNARIAALEAALTGIIEIGKRDMTNEKYDIYFDAARALLSEVTQ